MDFLKWWWWQVLDQDTREEIMIWLTVIAIVATVVVFVGLHMLFYPWMFCIDFFLAATVFVWYFSRQHKTWQELEEEDEEEDDV